MGKSKILDNIYLDVFLLLASDNCFITDLQPSYLELYFLILSGNCWKFCILKEIFLSLLIFFVFFIQKQVTLGTVGCRKLPNPWMNNIFNVVSIGLQYILPFQWSDFDLKCFVTITPKGQSLKLRERVSVWNFPDSEISWNCNSLFKLVGGCCYGTKKKYSIVCTCTFLAR